LAIRLQVPQGATLVRLALHPIGKAILFGLLASTVLAVGAFVYFYVHY
jgi:hypothetical protein